MAEISALANDLGRLEVISLSDGTGSNRLWIYYTTSFVDDNSILVRFCSSGGGWQSYVKQLNTYTTSIKILAAYDSNGNNFELWINGYQVLIRDLMLVLHGSNDRLNVFRF